MTRTVSIIYRFLPHYRYDFFSRLREVLLKSDIRLDVIYGKAEPSARKDEVDLEWGLPIKNKVVKIAGREFFWQPIPEQIYESDLIILMQENRIISNYLIMLKCLTKKRQIAWWGHGINYQADPNSLGNRFKKLYSSRASWWFAYTEGVAQTVANMGFPRSCITVVQNAIDTASLIAESQRIDQHTLKTLRHQLGLDGGPVGLFCGGIYKEKQIEFLLKACLKIREIVPGFSMMFIGAGPDSDIVRDFCEDHKWAHYLGPIFGNDRIPYFLLADAFLMPGVVGLAILDCFALKTPLVTTSCPYHGPEIEYMIDKSNGIMTNESEEAFVEGVVRILSSSTLRDLLRRGCSEAANKYTLENMVNNFSRGIEAALSFS